jgi:hypothetical protein
MSTKPDLISSMGLVIGILLGIASFLAQKEADKIDNDIDAMHESVASVSNFKAKYLNDIEDAYLLNVKEFDDLLEKCHLIADKLTTNPNYCSHDYPDAGELKISDLYEAFELFESPYIDKPNFDIYNLIETDSFLKHHVKYSLLKEMLSNNTSLLETFSTLRSDWAYLSDIASKNENTLSKYKDEDIISQIHNQHIQRLSYSICCTVIEMRKSSESLHNYASTQVNSFCQIKKETFDFLDEAYKNPFYAILSTLLVYNKTDMLRSDLAKDIEKESKEPNKRCTWTPKPMCPYNDVCLSN